MPDTPDEQYLFYESNVIKKLVLNNFHADYDYFGVLGHRWPAKLNETRSWSLPLRNLSQGELTPNALTRFVIANSKADFISLGRFIPHPVFRIADQIHPGWLQATTKLLESIGIRFNLLRNVPQPIYFNYFIGKRQAMDAYVKDILAPAIEAATHDQDLRRLCFSDAGYRYSLPTEISDLYGIKHYPLHPFIGERLINVYTLLSGSRVAAFDESDPKQWGSRLFLFAKPTYYAVKWRLEPWQRLMSPNKG